MDMGKAMLLHRCHKGKRTMGNPVARNALYAKANINRTNVNRWSMLDLIPG